MLLLNQDARQFAGISWHQDLPHTRLSRRVRIERLDTVQAKSIASVQFKLRRRSLAWASEQLQKAEETKQLGEAEKRHKSTLPQKNQ